jgi:hypothetical protein
MKMTFQGLMGLRTFIGGMFAMSCMTFAMWMVDLADRSDAFMAYSVGIVGIVGAIAGKAAVDSLAGGTGLQGMKAAFMTSAKPGTPASSKGPKPECSPENG